MAKSGPIIVLDDDVDDLDIFKQVLAELEIVKDVIWFTNPSELFQYLLTTTEQPFIIFCDINLPSQSGLELKREIDSCEVLRKKSIPFVFYSTAATQWAVNEAFTKMTIQGFFVKQTDYAQIKNTIKMIIDYWMNCRHPNVDD